MPWPRFLRRDRNEEESVTRGIVATAAVKAEAMTLVGNIRQTLRDLDKVLQDEATIDETGRRDTPRAESDR